MPGLQWGTCRLCGTPGVLVSPLLKPWPRLEEHKTPDGRICFQGAPGTQITREGAVCTRKPGTDPACADCLRAQYQDETGRTAPARGDYAAWRSQYLDTGSILARQLMEDAVRPDAVAVKEEEAPARAPSMAEMRTAAIRRATRPARLACAYILILDAMLIPVSVAQHTWDEAGPYLFILAVFAVFILASLRISDTGKR